MTSTAFPSTGTTTLQKSKKARTRQGQRRLPTPIRWIADNTSKPTFATAACSRAILPSYSSTGRRRESHGVLPSCVRLSLSGTRAFLFAQELHQLNDGSPSLYS